MLRLRDYMSFPSAPVESGVSRRVFLKNSAFLVVGGSVVGWVGCGEASDPTAPGDNNGDNSPTDYEPPIDNPPDEGDGNQNNENPPDEDPPDEDPKPAGVEVEMDGSLMDVGGTQRVTARGILAELDTDNGNGRGNEPILLIRVAEDEVAANTEICTHQQCIPAFNGNDRLNCPCHGSVFGLDGRVINGPAGRPLLHFKATIHEDSVFLEKA